MKKILCILAAILSLSSCSIKHMAYNAVADMLAPPPPKETKTPKAIATNVKNTKNAPVNPMSALTGENDPQLVSDFFPTALKLYEIMHFQNPTHEGLSSMTGQLYIMYANAFIQTPAEQLPSERYNEQNDAYMRAQNFYSRGKRYVLESLDHKYAGFSLSVFGSDPALVAKTLAKCKKTDVTDLYWAGAGALGAFSLSPLNTDYIATLNGAVAMLERGTELDPSFNNGAIWEVLMSFYAGAPDSLGGGKDKALAAYEKALQYSKGKSPGTHIGYARAFCIPSQDSAGFDIAIEKALAIDPESQIDNRLVLTIAHTQALWLKEHKSDFILE